MDWIIAMVLWVGGSVAVPVDFLSRVDPKNSCAIPSVVVRQMTCMVGTGMVHGVRNGKAGYFFKVVIVGPFLGINGGILSNSAFPRS